MADNKTSIVITATDRASATLKQVEGGLGKLGGTIGSLIPQLGALTGALALGGVAVMVNQTIDAMAALDDMAAVAGTSVENMSALAEVAKVGGHELGMVQDVAVKLNKALHESGEAGKKAEAALSAIGLKAADLRKMDTAEAMLAIAKASDKFAADGGRAQVMIDLLGRSGAQAIPYMQDLAEAGQLVATTTTEQAAQAEQYQKNLNALSAEGAALARELTASLLPALTDVTKTMRDGAREGGLLNGVISGLGTTIRAMLGKETSPLGRVAEEIGEINRQLGDLDSRVNTFGTPKNKGQELKLFEMQQARAMLLRRRDELGQQAEQLSASSAGEEGKPALDYVSPVTGSGKKPKKDPYAGLAGFDDNRSAREVMAELHKQDAALETIRQKYIALADPLQKYRDELEEIDRLEAAKALSADQALEARWKINEAMDDQFHRGTDALKEQNEIVKELGLTFTSAFEDAIVGGKKFSDVLKGLAADIQRIIMRKTVTEPLGNAISSWTKSVDWGSMFKFADGGVMTAGGPLPLRSYASGGIASSPQIALFGEGAQNEAFVPLPDGRRIPVAMQGATAAPDIIVNVINNTGTQATAKQQGPARMDGGRWVVGVVMDALANDTGMRAAVAGVR